MSRWKPIIRTVCALAMVAVGITHFARPAGFVAIVPSWLPDPLLLVYVSGAAEIAGGLGLLLPATRRWAAYGLILLYICVFPANVNMAVHRIPVEGRVLPDVLLWGRLPFQLLFIWVAYWFGKPDRATS